VPANKAKQPRRPLFKRCHLKEDQMKLTSKNRLASMIVLVTLFAFSGCGGGGGGGGAPAGGGAVTPQADTFDWTGNTPLTVGVVAGLLANDPVGSVITDTGARFTTLGGTANVNANGAFTYTPPPGAQNVQDTFTYTTSGVVVTVTINLVERVVFVDNTELPGGDGSFARPFASLGEAETASDANDTIFVFAGNTVLPIDLGPDRVVTLQSDQRLIGEGVGLRVNGIPIVDPVPNAVISNDGPADPNTPVVLLSTGNEVAGFTINAAFNEGILTLGGSGHNVHDNTITFDPDNGREGIRLLNVTGENSVTFNTITGSPRDGIKLANNEDVNGDFVVATPIVAAVTISRNTISNSAQDGINVSLEGAGTDVTLNILTNRITNSGTAGADEGIDIDGIGGAIVTAVVSRNTVTQSTDEAIDLQAGAALAVDTSSFSAFVANSDLSLSGAGVTDFLASAAAGSAANFCLELENNVSSAVVPSTFQVENNGTGVFRFFEGIDNDSLAIRVGVTPVAQGDCAIPLPGAQLFVANCTICHTGNGLGFETRKVLIAPDVTNQPVAEINFQLATNGSMININLTGREVDAIAADLVAGP
jgi:hypothetical protein